MRKRIIGSTRTEVDAAAKSGSWFDLEHTATAEVTSEDPGFPVEAVFQSDNGAGWRAAQDGEQQLRLIFDQPTTVRRMQLHFVESEIERTQEFTIRWSTAQGGPQQEVVRQQWTFSPAGSTREVEHYDVNLEGVAVLELSIRPDLNEARGRATLLKWRVG
jgi:hypothetical protein